MRMRSMGIGRKYSQMAAEDDVPSDARYATSQFQAKTIRRYAHTTICIHTACVHTGVMERRGMELGGLK
jgi:hypothetical protein